MRSLTSRCAVVCWLAIPALASAQSLGDAARKERDRREKVREVGGSAPTLTEEDLATTKGTLANDPNAQPASDGPDAAAARGGGTRVQRLPASPDPSSETQEEYWRRHFGVAKARVERAQRRYDGLQRMIRIGQPD